MKPGANRPIEPTRFGPDGGLIVAMPDLGHAVRLVDLEAGQVREFALQLA